MRIAVIGAGRMGAIRVEDLRPLVDDIIIANRTPATAVELALAKCKLAASAYHSFIFIKTLSMEP